MGSLAGQFLLESLLAPFAIASLVLLLARRFDLRQPAYLSSLLAMLLAVGTAYVLAFGWPTHPALGARNKIILAAIIAAIAGIVLQVRTSPARTLIAAGAVVIVLWIGFPALLHGRPVSALLVLPITLALAAIWLFDRRETANRTPPILIMLVLAFGLAAIALFAKTFSLAQISLSLGSALLAILAFGHGSLMIPATFFASAMLLGLTTALLLYNQANVFAVTLLGVTLAAGHLARLSSMTGKSVISILRHVAIYLLPAAIAIMIARIDAGPISLY